MLWHLRRGCTPINACLGAPVLVPPVSKPYCNSDGGYESDSEEGEANEAGQIEVTDDAIHCFSQHTG